MYIIYGNKTVVFFYVHVMGKLINLVDAYMTKLAEALFCDLGCIYIYFFLVLNLFNWINEP